MWALRVLSGPQAGSIFDLKMGRNLIGRAPHCDIKIMSAGVSKEHTEITVMKEKLVITDLRSSNGTFVNGVRVQNSLVRLGDKLGIHDVLLDIIPAPEVRAPMARVNTSTTGIGAPPPMPYYGNVGSSQQIPSPIPQPMATAGLPGIGTGVAITPAPAYSASGLEAIKVKIEDYLEKVALPGVYKLPKFLEFKAVILGFIVLFIFVTTFLSMIPMVQITRSSIIKESERRAASVARTLATINQAALIQNSFSALSTSAAETEEGVTQALIVQQSDGMILAPASRAGNTPDLPFVHTARREMRPQTVQIDSSTIGASFPIGLFDPNTGEQSIKAHAIVIYDVGALNFDDGRALSLFFQTLLIALIVGYVIYFFMYKLIEHPITALNTQLDIALREKRDHTEVDLHFPAFQALVGNVNSLLSRYVHGDGNKASGLAGSFFNKDGEAENLVQIVGYPCIAISREGRIISANAAFSQVARAESLQLAGQSIKQIPDMALQQNLEGLIAKSQENPRLIQNDHLEFGGHKCILNCQALTSNGSEVDFYVVTVLPTEGTS